MNRMRDSEECRCLKICEDAACVLASFLAFLCVSFTLSPLLCLPVSLHPPFFFSFFFFVPLSRTAVARAPPQVAAIEFTGEPAEWGIAGDADPLNGPHRAEPVQEPLFGSSPDGLGRRLALKFRGFKPEPQPPRR